MPKVLTQKGFREYDGVKISENTEKISVMVEGEITTCTNEHRFLMDSGAFKEAKDLSVNDVLYDGKVVENSTKHEDDELVYDLVNVQETHSYFTNNTVSHNCIYLDEFAFVENADEFFTSTYPVISSGKTTKVLITSTPKGMNLFHKLWTEANQGRNKFTPIEIHWSEHPNRDTAWKDETIANIGKKQFEQEYGCTFYGSSGTLIDGETLARLVWEEPMRESENIKTYEDPQAGHFYVATVDVCEGVGLDSSVIHITDITETPYRQVCIFRDNKIIPMVLTEIVERLAKKYNNAVVLIETNSVGAQIGQDLWMDYEYENLIMTSVKNLENVISAGFGTTRGYDYGLRTTQKSKRIGCSNIKTLIEEDILILRDYTTIQEFQTFAKKGNSYEAEEGKTDDIAMTLVVFGWLTTQAYFKDLMNADIRKLTVDGRMRQIEEEMEPFGFISDGGVDELNREDDDYGVPAMGMYG